LKPRYQLALVLPAMIKWTTVLLLFINSVAGYGQRTFKGVICDSVTHQPLPFATIKFDTHNGTVADLNGRFLLSEPDLHGAKQVECSYIGYTPKQISPGAGDMTVLLAPAPHSLTEVVVKPAYDRIRYILNRAVANKNRNNPDKYDWYQCKIYYKMKIDMQLPDTSYRHDTDASRRDFVRFVHNNDLFLSETYSRRTWRRPQQLQEDVVGTRISGFKKPMFTGLITDVLPFHSYADYISLNGKDYHNPVSRGYGQYYSFNLEDEIINERDTLWVLSFRPKSGVNGELRGSVYINSNGYAISDLIAVAYDTILKREVRVEQQYQFTVKDGVGRWFPAQLNYIIDWDQKLKTSEVHYMLRGNSIIDSVSFREDPTFVFDKAHTIRQGDAAGSLTDSSWRALRPLALDKREARSYHIIDSFGEENHFDKIMSYMAHLPEWKVPVGPVDIDLKRLYNSNTYESSRLGLGAQTNDRICKDGSLGGWAGYGFKDAHWKYGVFGELYADKEKSFVFKAYYNNDINDPGRIHIDPDLDKNYLSTYLLQRVDHTKTYGLDIRKKLGYWNVTVSGKEQQITPLYPYTFVADGIGHASYQAAEVSLGLRYAFAERYAPYFGHYYSVGTRFPVFYMKAIAGQLWDGPLNTPYTQLLGAGLWHKHINRIGFEHMLLEGGRSWSDGPLPLSKLFAGSGFRYNSPLSLYTFGGIMTMTPYEYYSDRFGMFIYRHDFDWKLYCVNFDGSSFSSAPFISLQYGVLYGKLANVRAQQGVAFSVPDNGYHEAGAMLTDLIRINYLDLYYFTINAGYFYHIAPGSTGDNGKFVIGAGVAF